MAISEHETHGPTEAKKGAGKKSRSNDLLYDRELIGRLRKRLNMDGSIATDNEILRQTEGTFLRALEELDMASEACGGVLRKEINQCRKRMSLSIKKFITAMGYNASYTQK